MSIPNSTIYICSVAFNSSFEHTPFFESRSAQQSTFAECVQRTYSAYTFLRETTSIKVQAHKNDTETWNYLYFTNNGGSDYYYYFIDRIEYINDQTVELFLTLDVMQTYHFRYNLLPSFVERKHTMTDGIGDNIVEEGLDLGEFTIDEEVNITDMDELVILILSSVNLKTVTSTTADSIYGAKVDGVFSGFAVFGCPVHRWATLKNALNNLDTQGKGDAVLYMWMYPKKLVTLCSGESWVPITDTATAPIVEVYGYNYFNTQIGRTERLDRGYYPTNKKLLTYPYKFIYATNNLGSSAIYRFEDFTEGSYMFRTTGTALPDGGCRMYPINYKGSEHNWDEGISLTGFPSCAWNQDVYKMWLAQNLNTQNLAIGTGALTIAGGVATTIGSIATANPIGIAGGVATMVGGGTKIANVLASRKDSEVQPPQAKGSLSGSVNAANKQNHFTIQIKTIKNDCARMIDDYFSLYGYAIKRVMKPQGTANGVDYDIRCARKCYTYIKTQDARIRGSLPSDHAKQIEQIYDKGITFWRNGQNIGEFWLDNSPL